MNSLPSNPTDSFKKRNPHLYQDSSPPTDPHIVSMSSHPSKTEEKLNKTERAFLDYARFLHREVGVQRITFKIGDDCRFTPDFDYRDREGNWVFVDVKGFQREDALVKIKTTARMFPFLRFYIVKRLGSGWEFRHVSP